MLINYYPAESKDEVSVAISPQTVATITINYPEVSAKSGGGDHLDVVRIDVQGEDRTVGRFWVDVHLNNQGRPVLHIATNVGNETRTKKLVGSWRTAGSWR